MILNKCQLLVWGGMMHDLKQVSIISMWGGMMHDFKQVSIISMGRYDACFKTSVNY